MFPVGWNTTMEAIVMDTLRYADRLKAAGVETNQTEAMSRALNDELTGGVATKDDLEQAILALVIALSIYNTVGPYLLAKGTGPADVISAQAGLKAPTPVAPDRTQSVALG